MSIKQVAGFGVISLALFAGGVAVGQQDIDPKIHPHLFQAQRHITSADQEIEAAQAAWGDKLGGHAEKAKNLLHEADGELKQAALYANKYK